jgi:hypothetical protein
MVIYYHTSFNDGGNPAQAIDKLPLIMYNSD